MLRRGLIPFSLALAVACGGASQQGRGANDVTAGEDSKLGEYAATHGGIPTLGQQGEDSSFAPEGLRLDLVEKDRPVKLDGVLQEWPARASAKNVVKGSPGRVQLAVALQYDETKIYAGAEVTDDKLVRTGRFGSGEDHASLILAFPNAPGSSSPFAVYEVGFFAGKPGQSSGSVRFLSGGRQGAAVPGSKIVEAPTANGYSFEAVVPWSAFPESHLVRVGLHGAARYYGADAPGAVDAVIATGDGDVSTPAQLPPLPTEPELSLIEKLLAPKGLLHTAPKPDLVADVVGDAMKERIAVFDKYLVVLGPGYLDGASFFFKDLGKDLGAELVKLELRDVTGRGKDDVLLRRRFTKDAVSREWFEVLSFLGNGEPVTTFGHEIAIASSGKRIDNALHISNKEIEVSAEPASGWDAASYHEPVASDIEPALLPWGPVKSQFFHFDGKLFTRAKEVAQASQAQGGAGGAPPPPAEIHPPEPPTPKVRAGGSDLAKQVLELYKRDHGVAADQAPKFDLQVQVTGDARPERVVLLGRDIVVFGPGFKSGTGYAFLTLSLFADAADIHEMTARDVTGDGAADLVVRGGRHVNVSGSSDAVDQDMLLVYQVSGDTIARIFGIETGREQGGKRIQGLVQFVPARGGKTFDILVSPGRATGWTEKTYPWAQDQPGSGQLEPLLLPWGGIPSLRYTWDGTQFTH